MKTMMKQDENLGCYYDYSVSASKDLLSHDTYGPRANSSIFEDVNVSSCFVYLANKDNSLTGWLLDDVNGYSSRHR